MARRKRSAVEADTRAVDYHTPSSPSRPAVVCIYCSRQDNPDKILVITWATWVSAASWFELLIENEEGEPKWLKHPLGRWTQLVWPSGLTVTCRSDDLLERLVEEEGGWTVPEPYVGSIRQFLSDAPVADTSIRPRERGAPKERKERVAREKAPTKASNRPAGYVHVSELVPDVTPPHARQALRSLGWDKPEYGWWFDPARGKEVSKAIKGALK